MKIVAQCSDEAEASSVAAKLRAAGIKAFVHDTTTRQMRPGVPPYIAVSVARRDVAQSVRIISSEFPHLAPIPDISICRQCRNTLENDQLEIPQFSLLTKAFIAIVARLSFKAYCPVCRQFHKV